MNICKAINCPFFNSATNGYGCQRYLASNHCHLIQQFPNINFNPNQYALSSSEKLNLDGLKQANVEFFTTDEVYLDKLEHQQTHPDWYTDTNFKIK